jgi:predicted nucleic acid-binding protein
VKTEPVTVCLDADVVIAGLFSRAGASHAILVLAEVGLLRVVVPVAVIGEVRRNLEAKLPEALPSFDSFLKAPFVSICRPTDATTRRARPLAHKKDVPVLAAALAAEATLLATHNTRHFRSSDAVRVLRPRKLIEEARAWMANFGR